MYATFQITFDRLHGTENKVIQARTADRAVALAEARHGGTVTAIRTLPDGYTPARKEA